MACCHCDENLKRIQMPFLLFLKRGQINFDKN